MSRTGTSAKPAKAAAVTDNGGSARDATFDRDKVRTYRALFDFFVPNAQGKVSRFEILRPACSPTTLAYRRPGRRWMLRGANGKRDPRFRRNQAAVDRTYRLCWAASQGDLDDVRGAIASGIDPRAGLTTTVVPRCTWRPRGVRSTR